MFFFIFFFICLQNSVDIGGWCTVRAQEAFFKPFVLFGARRIVRYFVECVPACVVNGSSLRIHGTFKVAKDRCALILPVF